MVFQRVERSVGVPGWMDMPDSYSQGERPAWSTPGSVFRPEPVGSVLAWKTASTVQARTHWNLPDNCSQGWGSSLVFTRVSFQAWPGVTSLWMAGRPQLDLGPTGRLQQLGLQLDLGPTISLQQHGPGWMVVHPTQGWPCYTSLPCNRVEARGDSGLELGKPWNTVFQSPSVRVIGL